MDVNFFTIDYFSPNKNSHIHRNNFQLKAEKEVQQKRNFGRE